MKNSPHGISGVHSNKYSFVVHIGHEGRTHHVGSFSTIEEAALARKQAEKEYWGA